MRIALATTRTAFQEAWSTRAGFWFQVSIMVANDAVWVAFWILFFRKVGTLRGWDTHEVLLLFAILCTCSGISLGLLANARRIGELVAGGGIDAALALPTNPLTYLLTRRVDTALLGDFAFGPILFLAAGHPTPERALLFVFGVLCGSAVLVGFLVALGSLTFFAGGRGEHADLGFQAILIFASYPLDVFGGLTKLFLFTAVPAAFVSGLPTRIVTSFSWPQALAAVAAAVVFAALGAATFSLGLRRYSSGAIWTRA
jgi:viologen exporter family transport system permease protein